MGNCLSKFNDKPVTLHTPPLTAGHLKKVVSGIWKNSVKYFASGIHWNYGYERLTQIIKSSLIDVYDRFPLQSFELLDGVPQSLKSIVIKKILYYAILRGCITPFRIIFKHFSSCKDSMIPHTGCTKHKNLMPGSMDSSFSGSRYLYNVIS